MFKSLKLLNYEQSISIKALKVAYRKEKISLYRPIYSINAPTKKNFGPQQQKHILNRLHPALFDGGESRAKAAARSDAGRSGTPRRP